MFVSSENRLAVKLGIAPAPPRASLSQQLLAPSGGAEAPRHQSSDLIEGQHGGEVAARRRWIEGLIGCVSSGVLGTMQYAVVTLGEEIEKAKCLLQGVCVHNFAPHLCKLGI